jgi:hypothetical protein
VRWVGNSNDEIRMTNQWRMFEWGRGSGVCYWLLVIGYLGGEAETEDRGFRRGLGYASRFCGW